MKRLAYLLGVLAVVAGCSSSSSSTTASTTPTSAGTSSRGPATGLVAIPAPTPTHRVRVAMHPYNSRMPVEGKPLVDGEYFGFLSSVDLDRRELGVNFAQWLSGRRASRAAYADGYISSPTEDVPNDYYVEDVSDDVRMVPVSSNVLVTIFECGVKGSSGCGQYRGTLQGLAKSLEAPLNKPFGAYEGRSGKYWLRFRLGQVVEIDEIFTP